MKRRQLEAREKQNSESRMELVCLHDELGLKTGSQIQSLSGNQECLDRIKEEGIEVIMGNKDQEQGRAEVERFTESRIVTVQEGKLNSVWEKEVNKRHWKQETESPDEGIDARTLREHDQNVIKREGKVRKEKKTGQRGSWKRIGFKDREEAMQGPEQNKKNTPQCGQKRFKLQDMKEGYHGTDIEESHRNKHQKAKLPTIGPLVEVASQNLPQMDK